MSEKSEKRRDALGLFYESVLKPDHQLRECAHNQECYHELMEWRSEIIEYLDGRRNHVVIATYVSGKILLMKSILYRNLGVVGLELGSD